MIGRERGAEVRRRWRLRMGDATFYMLQGDEVQISALKEYVPCRHVCVSHLSSHLGLQNCNAVQQKAV